MSHGHRLDFQHREDDGDLPITTLKELDLQAKNLLSYQEFLLLVIL
jgi:hypothetical protein